MTSGIRALFAPRGVAVVGASQQADKMGAVMARSLGGFAGGPLLVNTRHPDPAGGLYGSVRAAVEQTGRSAELAVLCVPAPGCAAALAEAADAGTCAALVCAGAFGEAGPEGQRHADELARVAAERGVRLLGPNTSGFFAPHLGLTASFVPAAGKLPAGEVAVVAASGGVNHALAFELAGAGNGISLGVGIGAGLNVAAPEILDYLADDPHTAAVALHVETVPDGRALTAAVRRFSATKPVAALVVGRSDVGDFARSHTGALATSWQTTRAALRQAGAVVVDDERELVDAVTALSRLRLEPGHEPGVGIVTAQAGPGLLLADRLGADGIRVPELDSGTQQRIGAMLPPSTYQRNPVDTGRPSEYWPEVLAATADDPAVDLLTAYALSEPDSVDPVAAAQLAGLPDRSPTVVTIGGLGEDVSEARIRLHKLGIPAFSTAAGTTNAVRALVTDARARACAQRAVGSEFGPDSLPGAGTGAVDEAQLKAWLGQLGVAVPAGWVCTTHAEAHTALAELESPVAVKILDPTVLHKTDIGGVRLGITTTEQLDAALHALDSAGADRYLVETMAADGVDLILGARRDPVFGPIVVLGLGGTTAEALGDVAIRLAPVSRAEAVRMARELAGYRLLTGWRGGPIVDENTLGELIARVSQLINAEPGVSDLEINPLRFTPTGLVALDAVLIRAEEESGTQEEHDGE